MTPEDFIVKHIIKDIDCSEELKQIVIEDALLKYRRHQFHKIENLIFDTRKQLLKLMKKQGK